MAKPAQNKSAATPAPQQPTATSLSPAWSQPAPTPTAPTAGALAVNQPAPKSLALAGDVPDFLAGEKIEGKDQLGQYQQMQRVRTVQGLTKSDVKKNFGLFDGDVYLSPTGKLVARAGEPVVFTPLLFMPSFQKWGDRKDPAGKFVLETTYDPQSELAALCKNPNTREVPYKENPELKYRHVECRDFFVRIETGPAAGEVALLSFSRGEAGVGAFLCTTLNGRACSIYANRIQASSTLRKRANNEWFGLDLNNPPDGAYVTQETYGDLKKIAHEVETAFARGLVKIADDGEDDGAAEVAADIAANSKVGKL